MNTERTIATIRRVLIDNPAADVKFVDAIAADSHFVSTNGRVLVLFVNPEHRELIEKLRQASRSAESAAGPGSTVGVSEHPKEPS